MVPKQQSALIAFNFKVLLWFLQFYFLNDEWTGPFLLVDESTHLLLALKTDDCPIGIVSRSIG